MSIAFPGFCGVSYQLSNKYAAIERTVNWFVVPNEARREETKDDYFHEPTPCNKAFCTLPVPAPFNQINRGLLELHEGAYGVNGTIAFYIDSTGAFTNIGSVISDGKPVSMVANGNKQIFIASAGQGYVIQASGAGSTLTQISVTADGFLGASYATFQDGYILVVTPSSNQFQISGTDDTPIGDATLWSAANVSVQAGQADNLRAILSSREYVRLLGYRRSQVYYNIGANGIGGFAFQSYNETFIETGLAATFSLVDLGDSLIWIGQDSRGVRACWRDPAFQPQRVSTFAVEQFWQGYADISDAVAFSYIWLGHLHYRITFPSASISPQGVKTAATWDYDVTASQLAGRSIWTEAQYSNSLGYLVGRPELFHCYAYGKHLVGSGGADGNPGAIYQWAGAPYTDCGTDNSGNQVEREVVRDRICPHLWNSYKRIIYDRIEFELSRGVGLDGSPATGADPQLLLRWSNDAGNSYGNWQNIPVGKLGQYAIRVYWNRSGYARDRVFWVRYSDPTYMGLVNAMLDVRECSA